MNMNEFLKYSDQVEQIETCESDKVENRDKYSLYIKNYSILNQHNLPRLNMKVNYPRLVVLN